MQEIESNRNQPQLACRQLDFSKFSKWCKNVEFWKHLVWKAKKQLLYSNNMFVHNNRRSLFNYSNQLVSFFLRKLGVYPFFIKLSFAFLNDIFLVSACSANIFVSVINNSIDISVLLQKCQCCLLLVGHILWSFHSHCSLEYFIESARTL